MVHAHSVAALVDVVRLIGDDDNRLGRMNMMKVMRMMQVMVSGIN